LPACFGSTPAYTRALCWSPKLSVTPFFPSHHPPFEDFMSDASHSHEEEAHEGPIKTPKQLITTIVFSVLVPVFTIVLLAILELNALGLMPWKTAPNKGLNVIYDGKGVRNPLIAMFTLWAIFLILSEVLFKI
jgi:hypothetical protein